MKRALLYLLFVASAVAGVWGYAYEFAYFQFLGLDVNDTLSAQHYVYTGLSNVAPMLAIALLIALISKFFSRDLARDDMKAFKDQMSKSKLAQEVTGARIAFAMSLVFLLLVLFDVRFGSAQGLGHLFWLITFFNMQVFAGAIYLSPPHSKVAVVVAFVAAVSLCFAAGGVEHARQSAKESIILRNDAAVHVERTGAKFVATAKALRLPIPPLQRALDWLRSL